MKPAYGNITRREWMTRLVASTAVVAAHRGTHAAPTESRDGAPDRAHRGAPASTPRIVHLELLSAAAPDAMRAFYHDRLGLNVLEQTADRLVIAGGQTTIAFVGAAEAAVDRPFYHFAFNIPENKIAAARQWQTERSPLLPIPEHLRDARFAADVVDYRHWNAHSVFFLDPAGNVVEYIARHDLNNAAAGPFTSRDILYASEIGLIVDDVRTTAAKLKDVASVEQYRGGDENFTALGDEHGLLLVMKRGRILNFNRASTEKAARVYRTRATIRGGEATTYALEGFPYELRIDS